MSLMVILYKIDELQHFSENDLLTPVTPYDPGQFFNVITFVEGVKLMHMHESCISATRSGGLDAFFGENDFFDPSDPIVTSDPIINCA